MEIYELPIPQLSSMVKRMFPDAQKRIDAKECTACGTKINGVDNFRDETSIKEYAISGLCMGCQDAIFR